MVNFTSKTHQLKRKILSFSNKISRNLQINIVDRLSRHLAKGTPKAVLKFRTKRPAYRQLCLKLTA